MAKQTVKQLNNEIHRLNALIRYQNKELDDLYISKMHSEKSLLELMSEKDALIDNLKNRLVDAMTTIDEFSLAVAQYRELKSILNALKLEEDLKK